MQSYPPLRNAILDHIGVSDNALEEWSVQDKKHVEPFRLLQRMVVRLQNARIDDSNGVPLEPDELLEIVRLFDEGIDPSQKKGDSMNQDAQVTLVEKGPMDMLLFIATNLDSVLPDHPFVTILSMGRLVNQVWCNGCQSDPPHMSY